MVFDRVGQSRGTRRPRQHVHLGHEALERPRECSNIDVRLSGHEAAP
jgi:hypothetical protein